MENDSDWKHYDVHQKLVPPPRNYLQNLPFLNSWTFQLSPLLSIFIFWLLARTQTQNSWMMSFHALYVCPKSISYRTFFWPPYLWYNRRISLDYLFLWWKPDWYESSFLHYQYDKSRLITHWSQMIFRLIKQQNNQHIKRSIFFSDVTTYFCHLSYMNMILKGG